jgi:hypothetical protein
MRFEDIAFAALLLAMIFIVYQDISYIAPDDEPGAMNDLIYRNGQDKDAFMFPAADKK